MIIIITRRITTIIRITTIMMITMIMISHDKAQQHLWQNSTNLVFDNLVFGLVFEFCNPVHIRFMVYISPNLFFHSIFVALEISKVVKPNQEELPNNNESMKMDTKKLNNCFEFNLIFFLFSFSFFVWFFFFVWFAFCLLCATFIHALQYVKQCCITNRRRKISSVSFICLEHGKIICLEFQEFQVEFLPILHDEGHAEKKQSRKYYIKSCWKALSTTESQEHDGNILAQNHGTPEGHSKFLITWIFAREALNRDCYDSDVHCPRSYTILGLENSDLHHDIKKITEINTPTTKPLMSNSIPDHNPALRRKRKSDS